MYKGANPNNYIEFSSEIWRIIAKEADGTYKIIREIAANRAWNSAGDNSWANSDIIGYFGGSEFYITQEAKNYIHKSHEWNIGPVTMGNTDLAAQIESEKSEKWYGDYGLISHSDFIRANSNKELCGNDYINYYNFNTCKNTDWLYVGTSYWTMSRDSSSSYQAWEVTSAGSINTYTVNYSQDVKTVTFLKSTIKLSGSGTQSDSYKIID